MKGANERSKLVYALETYLYVYIEDEVDIEDIIDDVMTLIDNDIDDAENRARRREA